jgi:hypothetical protein
LFEKGLDLGGSEIADVFRHGANAFRSTRQIRAGYDSGGIGEDTKRFPENRDHGISGVITSL